MQEPNTANENIKNGKRKKASARDEQNIYSAKREAETLQDESCM